jgi:hypothetical protein
MGEMHVSQVPQTSTRHIKQHIKVSKETYNIIRSIVDSSTKTSYEFNKPIDLNGATKFTKYRGDTRFWQIKILPTIIRKGDAEFPAVTIVVEDGFGRRVAELITSEYKLSDDKYYVLRVDGIEISAELIYEFEYYVITPDADVPYAKPISAGDFVNKLMFYKSLASG